MTFQTSDLAKLALFMYISKQLSRKQNVIKNFKKGFLPLIIPVIIICLLIAPANLSTALLVGGTALMLMFIGRVKTRHILLVVGVALLPLIFLILVSKSYYDKEQHKTKELPSVLTFGRMPTWIKRVQDFMYADKADASYQVQQAKIAIAKGGWFGKGPGKSEQRNFLPHPYSDFMYADKADASYQVQQAKIAIAKGGWFGKGPGKSEQRNFLPHPYSDFIYAIIIEEYGLLGGAIIMFIYLLFLFRSIRLFQRCPYAFGAFLAVALSFTLVIQAMVNM